MDQLRRGSRALTTVRFAGTPYWVCLCRQGQFYVRIQIHISDQTKEDTYNSMAEYQFEQELNLMVLHTKRRLQLHENPVHVKMALTNTDL